MGWSDERVELLKSMWADGVSASHIAKKLGGVTRNAVIGKVHRLGLIGRARAALPGSARAAVAKMARRRVRPFLVGGLVVERSEPRPPRAVVVEREEAAGLCTIETLSLHVCKWPIGDPQDSSFTFCGATATGTYCATHEARAYDRSRAKPTAKDLTRALRRYA